MDGYNLYRPSKQAFFQLVPYFCTIDAVTCHRIAGKGLQGDIWGMESLSLQAEQDYNAIISTLIYAKVLLHDADTIPKSGYGVRTIIRLFSKGYMYRRKV